MEQSQETSHYFRLLFFPRLLGWPLSIWKYEDEMGGESYEGSMGRSYRGGSYDGGSYARGRRRDSRGRYSRDGSYRSYRSYDDGKEEYMSQLHELMENAPDEQSRQSIQRMISQMEQ